jgi:hypothetical protein
MGAYGFPIGPSWIAASAPAALKHKDHSVPGTSSRLPSSHARSPRSASGIAR